MLWLAWHPTPVSAPHIPAQFEAALPESCSQVMLVLAPEARSSVAQLWLLERQGRSDWQTASGSIPVTLGHHGLAWGKGEHHGEPPPGSPIKHEGDLCSPAGVFRIPTAFGLLPVSETSWLKLPYIHLTPTVVGVDDPKSSHYNEIVDSSQVARDWDSNEPMSRHTVLYRLGAFIAHNPERTPGDGSCIFLHLWPGPGKGTAGCTAMAEEDLKRVLSWLDPAREPRLVQGLEGW